MKEIDWIKKAVGCCIDDHLAEQNKRLQFEVLKAQYESFSEEERETVKNIIKAQFDIKDNIYIYSVFLCYMRNEDFEEAMLDAILECDFDVYTGSMVEFQNHKYYRDFSGLYQKVRAFHKRNVGKFAGMLGIDWPYRVPSCRNKNRIVIITEQLLNIEHAPTRIVYNFAYMLKKLGYEVRIFVCPSDKAIPASLWHHPFAMNSNPAYQDVPMVYKYRGCTFEGYQINMAKAALKEYHMMFSLIYEWNPMFVFNIGAINPVVDIAAGFTTLAVCEMSIVCPVSEGEILVRFERSADHLEKKYASAMEEKQTQLYMDEKMPIMVENAAGACTRAELGLPEHKFLAAIVGNRLNMDIDPDFIHVMETLLKRIPDLDFVMIGDAEAIKALFTQRIFRNRVHFLGYRNDLMEVYQTLDLYVNPDRAGGGFSSAMALIAGIPVVTLPDCDVSGTVGEEFVVPDYPEMIETVCSYAQKKDFYEKKVKGIQDYKEQNTDLQMEKYIEKMVNGILKIINTQEVP